jgi:1-acyl-sn-glycerol-3-phosphate acyltransferase
MKIVSIICSFVFYLLFILFSAIYIPSFTVNVLVVRIFTNHRRAMMEFRKGILYYGKIIIVVLPRFFIKIKFKSLSKEKITDQAIYIANHRATSDAFLMGILNVEVVQVVNLWPFKVPVLGIMAKCAGYLSVREMSFEDFLSKCNELLEQKVSIVAFPEGTRSGNKKMGNFHGGLFRVALENKVPIVPLCIMGSEDKPKRRSWILNCGTINIHQLEPIEYEEYKDMSSFKLKSYVRNKMQVYIDRVEGGLNA